MFFECTACLIRIRNVNVMQCLVSLGCYGGGFLEEDLVQNISTWSGWKLATARP